VQKPQELAKRWVAFSIRRPWAILGVALILTVLALFFASRLKVRGDFAALLPKHYPSVKGFETITQRVGGLGFFMVVVDGPNAKQVRHLVKDLAPKFRAMRKDVRGVSIYKAPPFLKKKMLYLLPKEDLKELYSRLVKLKAHIQAETKRRNPMFIDLQKDSEKKKSQPPRFDDLLKKYGLKESDLKGSDLLGTPDGKLAVILLQPNGLESDVVFIERLHKGLKKTVAATLKSNPKRYGDKIRVRYTGRYMVKLEDDQALKSQITGVTSLSFVGVLLILFFSTRRKRSLLMIGVPLLLGVIWTAGVTWLVSPKGEINFITAFIVAVLFGLGIDFGIHLFTRYQTERLSGENLQDALEHAIGSTGAAGIIAVLTSAAAFFIIQLTDFKGLSQFGQVAGIGLLVILLSMMWVFPALAALFERRSAFEPTQTDDASKKRTVWITLKPRNIYWQGGLLFGLVTVAGAVALMATGSIKFEYDLWRLLTQGEAVKTYDVLKKNVFFGELEPSVFLCESHKQLRELETKLSKELKAGKWPTVRQILSIHSIVPAYQKQLKRQPLIAKIKKLLEHSAFENVPDKYEDSIILLEDMAKAKPYKLKDLPKTLKQLFGAGHPMLFIVPNINPTQIDKGLQYARDLVLINKKHADGKILAGDSNLIVADMFRLLGRDGPRSVGFVLIAVILLLFIALRGQPYAIWLVLTPIVVGFCALIVVMWLLQIRLNPFNVIMLPVTLGIGIDHGVYMYYHWHEQGRGPVTQSMGYVFYAVLLASVTSLVGFGSLALAKHQGIHSVGLLAALGILCSTVAAFVVLPSLFTWMQHKRTKQPE
jgi:predicted RND superfamily exporter protein